MKNLFIIILLSFLFDFSFQTYSQYDYFHGQKNVFAIHSNVMPRFSAMKKDRAIGSKNDNSMYGTYYNEYDNNNQLIEKQQKVNLMLNVFYGRLVKRNILLGFDFNYQKHHLTMQEGGFKRIYKNSEGEKPPFLASSPVFNIIEAQFSLGFFLGRAISPNKHLLQLQFGQRYFLFDKNQNYRFDEETPVENLGEFVQFADLGNLGIKKWRFSINYTYRILLTENLNLDLGVTTNFGIYRDMHSYSGSPEEYEENYNYNSTYYEGVFPWLYVTNRLGFETVRNVIYLKFGVSFDF